MFSDLALIDWIALVFAAVLLAAAAAAAIVAYATAKNRPIRTLTPLGHRPAHVDPPPPSGRPVPGPHATPSEVASHAAGSNGADHAGADQETDIDAPPILVGNRAPQPEMRSAPTPAHALVPNIGVMTNGVELEPSVAEENVAARAAKLRRRPVPDTDGGHKRIVSAVEPKRMPAHAPNRAFEPLSSSLGQLTIDKERTEGFAARTPGFFEDPVGRHELRYWDGHRWTEYVKEHGERFTDPL